MTSPHVLVQRIFWLLLLFLTACSAVGPDYQAPSPPMPAGWTATTGQTRVTAAEELNAWWQLFHDATLNDLVNQAITANQDIRIAETRIREARAARRLSGAAQQPALNLAAAQTRSRSYENTSSGPTDYEFFQLGFDASWELDFFGGVRRSVEMAEAQVASSVEAKRDVQVAITAEVARNYLELRGSQQRLAIARKNIAIQEKTVHIVEQQRDLGMSGELELEQAKSQLNMTRSLIPGLETAVIQAMNQLALLTARQVATMHQHLATAEVVPVTPPELPQTLPSDLLRRRPDIRQCERQLAAATAGIGVATADLFPRFSLSGLIGLDNANLSDLVTSGSRFWSFGPTIKWALLDGGKTRATIEISEAQRDRAKITYEKTVLAALVDVENALTAFAQEEQTNRHVRAAATAGERAATIARDQYQLGITNFLSVLQSEYALQQAQDQLAQSQQRIATNMVVLFKALGGGWETAVGTPGR